jgi:hypothetical protein
MMSIVAAAFFASGGLNAGTPFYRLNAGQAVQPFEGGEQRNRVNGAPIDSTGATGSTGATVPVRMRHVPTTIGKFGDEK